MAENYKELIDKRRSVRTYDGRAVSDQDIEKLEQYIENLKNPFGVPVEFRILDAGKFGLSSGVLQGEHTFIAAKVKRQPNFEIAYGYEFEMLCLYALSLGIGTVILAASLNRANFESAMELKDGEVMPVATPIGYPAAKMSIKEVMMRKGLGADKRKDFSKLFFDGSFEKPLDESAAGAFADALKAATKSPSAANKQPWRAVKTGDTVNFYEYQTIPDAPIGDVQKVDVGIALAHFDSVMKQAGHTGSFEFIDPCLKTPDGMKYIVSYELKS